jgi:AcrR family transcriptional regulator
VTDAILGAALRLLAEEGFPRMTMESVAKAAGVGKPAVYRRFRDKADLVAAAFASVLHVVDPPDLGDTRAELDVLFRQLVPPDPEGWVGFVGGLFAEHRRHPEVVEAFRRGVLLPRRAAARRAVERGQARGDLRGDLEAEVLLDFMVGPGLARILAGGSIDEEWRERGIGLWWELASAEGRAQGRPQR